MGIPTSKFQLDLVLTFVNHRDSPPVLVDDDRPFDLVFTPWNRDVAFNEFYREYAGRIDAAAAVDVAGGNTLANVLSQIRRAGAVALALDAFGIAPDTIIYNHLNQPRELVKSEAVTSLFA